MEEADCLPNVMGRLLMMHDSLPIFANSGSLFHYSCSFILGIFYVEEL
uniref:Uncharacterized protein n=1 Tax=Rhizophora mucronata TaxID=61149 RepID=A0A2P2QQC9_RHIMU